MQTGIRQWIQKYLIFLSVSFLLFCIVSWVLGLSGTLVDFLVTFIVASMLSWAYDTVCKYIKPRRE